MTERNSAIILFFSSNAAMWGARVLKHQGIPRRIMPVPRELSHDCGFCIMIDGETAAAAADILSRHGVEYDRIIMADEKPAREPSSVFVLR